MDGNRACPECGAALRNDAPMGLCPACLLKLGQKPEEPVPVPKPSLETTIVVTVPLTEKPGDRIGRYKLLRQIGEGGMGTVWEAEQQEPVRRKVALKVIKLGMDTKEVVARFEAERQALAL